MRASTKSGGMLLGIEIGGTKLQLGVGDGESVALSDSVRLDVDRDAGASAILEQVAKAASPLISTHRVLRAGVGFGGPVDSSSGMVIKSHQVAGWDDFALGDWCERTLGVPTSVGNDCDVAALAEAKFGAGRGHRVVLYVTVGTGVGGGLVVDGEIYGEHRSASMEIGHLRLGLSSMSPSGTVESLASGPGIVESVRRRLRSGSDESRWATLLRLAGGISLDQLTAKNVAEAAAGGHADAIAAFNDAAAALGWAIAQAITILSPDVVVIGGGVAMADHSLFLEPVRRSVSTYIFPPLENAYEIVPSALGEEVVVHGAIALSRTTTSR